jgi:hypothetical protein
MSEELGFRNLGDAWKARCNRKFRHKNKQAALGEAARLESLKRAKFEAYECSFCGKFHVAHAGGRKGEATAAWRSTICSVFQSRKIGFAKILDGRALQGGRIESNRRRH